AAAAYASALTLAPTDPDLLADAADARAAAMDKQFDPQALAWLDDALTRAPDHPKALWLAGTAALHGGDRERARSLWRRLLGVLPADSPDAEVIRANLRDLGDGAAPAVVVSGRVELAAELADAVQPDDTLFVFARAADGPAMPLAVLRRRAADLPLNFSLDDSMAMQPGHGISSAATVIVGARLSRSGRALAQPGDLEGSSAPVATSAADNLAIRIERKVVH
ncbi:MAG: c-type cytochrome biogenesis protein CcmI, partial [Gammaproteobacteria bacterium]|nr:c-type cytochrome biogenesis protein CcmI [Gammaproteobacteria bacterium]